MKNFNPKPFTLRASAIQPFIYCLLVLVCILFTLSSCGKDDTCTEKTWCQNNDGDPEGNNEVTLLSCTKPDGYIDVGGDPDDTNPNITSDCEQKTYYADEDKDDYGNPNNSITQCSGLDTPTGYVEDNTDCADDDPSSYPGQTYYEDSDMDGFGNPESFQMSCLKPEGYTLDATDCNDNLGPFIASEWTGTYNVERTKYSTNGTSSIDNFSCSIQAVEGQPNTLKLIGFWSSGVEYLENTLYLNIDPCTQLATWNQEQIIGEKLGDPYPGDITWIRDDFHGFSSNSVTLDASDDYGWCSLDFMEKTIRLYGVAWISEHSIYFAHYKCDMELVQE